MELIKKNNLGSGEGSLDIEAYNVGFVNLYIYEDDERKEDDERDIFTF